MAKILLMTALTSMGAGDEVRISDLIVPEIFNPYVSERTEEKSRLIQTGVMVRDPFLDNFLAGAGATINVPVWNDLANDEENYSNDDPAQTSTPKKIGTHPEVATRMNRNQSWSSMDLASQLIAQDPMTEIGNKVSGYWTRRLQTMFLACAKGVFADNAAAPTAGEHEQNDLTHDISGSAVSATTRFTGDAFIDTLGTIGDSEDDLGIVFMHSVVYNRAKKNNLIDFIPDATGKVNIPTYMGRTVIVDDGLSVANATPGVYETWVFGAGAFRFGSSPAKVPTETDRLPATGNGSGQDVLYNRVQWAIHPNGHAYVGTGVNLPQSGPTNAMLESAANWKRASSERKHIKMARLITREA